MAVTGIFAITETLDLAIKYICNKYKTDNGRTIQSYACTPTTAASEMLFTQRTKGTGQNSVLAHHIYQSFAAGEVTVEEAMEAGKKLADRLLKGQYEYVIATHLNTGKIHNHIIFNSVNMVSGRTFNTEHNRGGKAWYLVRKISDEICKEMNLSIVENAYLGTGKSYYEWLIDKEGKSYKSKLRSEIDTNIRTAKNFDDFIKKMRSAGYEVNNEGVYLKFKAPGQQRYTRSKTLGYYYTEEKIIERIEKNTGRRREFMQSLNLPQIIDTSQEKFRQGDGLEHWAKLKNFKAAAEILSYLSEHGISNDSQLLAKTDEMHEQRIEARESIKTIDSKINSLQISVRNLKEYNELKPLYDKYKTAKNKEKFFRENESNIMLYEEAVEQLRKQFGRKKLPQISIIQKQIDELKEKKDRLYSEYSQSKKEAYKLEKMRRQLDKYMRTEEPVKEVKEKDNNRSR